MPSISIPEQLSQTLWKHQKEAIAFAWKYLREPAKSHTGLIRMPTGTGKTGIIAVLSVAAPPPAWTLVLTPWKNLCTQMVLDLKQRFWKKARWTPTTTPDIERLYPSTLDRIIAKDNSQLVLVATFATLVSIFKGQRAGYDNLASKLSQVFVDEGHYEPAVEWGQAVKHLKRPTMLLTATPYRNDLKLFRVSKDDVYHYTHERAERDQIIRKVEFSSLEISEPSDKELEPWCDAFATFWKKVAREVSNEQRRAIICCGRMATVELVTTHLRHRGINALGIHERFANKKEDWFKQQTPTEEVSFDVWVHQNKLTEGLDDQRFCVLAVLNRIRNDRKLIQQIGRVLRRSRKKVGMALVLYSKGLSVERSWKNYREFEKQPDSVDPERYRKILDTILDNQPEMEYFGGRFRRRFESDSPQLQSQLLLPPSAVVRRIGKQFTLDEFTDFASDFLLLHDRILLGPDQEPLIGPDQSRLWVYAIFGNSRLLIEHSQYEIRLGATASVVHGDLLFVVDTEASYPAQYLAENTHKISPGELGRIFSRKMTPKEVSLTNPWPPGPCIKRSTVYADNLAGTPARLTDAVFVCSRVRAKSPPAAAGLLPRRQYVGFQRGRISEQIRSTERLAFSLTQFVNWTKELAQLIQAERRSPPEFFRRYLLPVPPPTTIEPAFIIFNLLEGEVEIVNELEQAVELKESIIEVGSGDYDGKTSLKFPCTLRYRLTNGKKETAVNMTLIYDVGSARFRIRSEELNSTLLVIDSETNEAQGLSNYLNSNDEAFAVAFTQPDIFYTAQAFYGIDYTHAETRLSSLLSPIESLSVVNSEKGKKGKRKNRWDTSSVFSVIDNRKRSGLIRTHFGKVELLFCDDLQTEVADFVCVNFSTRKIAFIHAKYGKGRIVSASALHEAVAQALKNLGVFSRAGDKPAHLNRWNRTSIWPGTQIRRWRAGSRFLPTKDKLWLKIRSDILDHPDATREVWLVVGDTLNKEALTKQLRVPEERDAVAGQLVHLLSSLHTNCTEINVALKVFCH